MRLYESLVRPLAFMFDPERAHNIAMSLIVRGMIKGRPFQDSRLRQSLFGVDFSNPLGLAAGFDKNAEGVNRWQGLGFGFAELGTITFHPQPGNPKPRLFRLPQHKALINRMGFNNEGAEAVSERLEGKQAGIPIGINLGKSKVTELEKAADDYLHSFRLLKKHGAYFVVNVSSPNTPGLRSLQEKGPLTDIVQAIRAEDERIPLFVKMAPDLEIAALDEVVQVAHDCRLTGLVATNTTLSRTGISGPNSTEAGGLSGAPLKDKANQFLSHLYKSCDSNMILMGVGGLFSASDAIEKIRLGAHLCQLYTGWIYGGPALVPTMLRDMCSIMDTLGVADLQSLRGTSQA